MRLLYVVDEHEIGDHLGPRMAINSLVENGILTDSQVFPFLVEEKKQGSWDTTLEILYQEIKHFQPELILISHIGKHQFSKAFIQKIRNLYTKSPVIAYDERDVYGVFQKPLPQTVIEISQNADLVYLVAGGKFADRFRKAGCKNILYLPHVANLTQFGKKWTPSSEREFDVIMIGNLVLSRFLPKSMPGAIDRRKLAYRLYDEFKDKFAVFGSGWGNVSFCKGSVNYDQQEATNHRSWITIGYDHFPDYEYYFSDRLPIALISGVPHLSYKAPGIENFFTDGYHCVFYESVEDAVLKVRNVLTWPKERLDAIGFHGSELARADFTEEIRMQKLVSKMIEVYSSNRLF